MDALKGIAAVKAAIDGLKILSQYADEVKDVQKRGEFMRIIGELKLELSQTQMRLAEQIEETQTLREKVSILEKEIENVKTPQSKLTFKNGLYYTEESDGGFCTSCYDNNNKKIRVVETPNPMKAHIGKYMCPICKVGYK